MLRWALAYDVEPVIFETTDHIGGMWKYKPEDTECKLFMFKTKFEF